jgi:hypothetical protein
LQHGIALVVLRWAQWRETIGANEEGTMNQNLNQIAKPDCAGCGCVDDGRCLCPAPMNFDDFCDVCAALLHDDEKGERWGHEHLCDGCAADIRAANPGLGPND